LPEARAAAERARLAISAARFKFDSRELRVTVSTGVAELQSEEQQAALFKRADDALYAAKKGGRNCLFWNDGHLNHRHETSSKSLARAPARDDLNELLGMAWTVDGDELTEAISSPTAVYVSSKPAFIDDMIRRLAQWRRDQTPLCLMLVQLGGFAEGIQKYGDDAAGFVLRVVAQILKANMRDMDHVSRLGSDTFALLLPGAQLADGVRCAERLRDAADVCRMPKKAREFPLELTIGVVETHDGDDLRRLLQRGRNALQVAIDREQGVFAQDVTGSLAHTPLAAYA
jgi:diguanylate cyclase